MSSSEQYPDRPRFTRRINSAILAALISSITALTLSAANYWLIGKQTLVMEQIKLEISKSTQKTAENVAATDAARLVSEKKNALIAARLNEARLTQDFSKLSNDLRPNISIECTSDYNQPGFLKLTCKFHNRGANRCKITPTSFNMLDGTSGRLIEKAISQVEHNEDNSVLAGGYGSNTYNIWLNPICENLISRIVQVNFLAKTDQQAIDMTRRLANGFITEDELKGLSQQPYTQNLIMKNWVGGN